MPQVGLKVYGIEGTLIWSVGLDLTVGSLAMKASVEFILGLNPQMEPLMFW